MKTGLSKTIFKLLPLLALNLVSCSEERETFTVEKGDIVESVYTSVVVEPDELYKITASIPGYIDEVTVREGDSVYAGQAIFYVRDIASQNNASNARLALDLAEKNYRGEKNVIDDMKMELSNAKVKRSNDSIQYFRIKKLYENGAVSKLELEQMELVYTSSKNTYLTLQNRIKRTERDLKASMEQAKNNFGSTLSRSEEATVRNRVNGIMYAVQKEVGEYVSMQEPIAIVGSGTNFTLKMLIDEIDITRVKIGQRILVNLEAYGEQVFNAKVTRIAPRMDTRTQTFEVEGVFENMPSRLFYGLTGEGNIIVKKVSNAIVIPREFLIDMNKVETDAGIKKVKVGSMSLSHAEIVEGLNEGDVIYKPL